MLSIRQMSSVLKRPLATSIMQVRKTVHNDGKCEFDQKESTQVLFRLAARLSYLQHHVDRVTVEEEVAFLMTHADLEFKSDVIQDLRSVFDSSGQTQRNNDIQRSHDIPKMIQRSRDMSRTVLREPEEQHCQEEKEIYLVKRFHRTFAERFFFDEVES